MVRVIYWAVLALLTLVPALNSASAAPITFIFTGTHASGSLNGTDFSDKAFTITALGDTSAAVDLGFGVTQIDHATASILIKDIGTFDFVTTTRTFFNDNTDTVGFAHGPFGEDLYDSPAIAALSGWDMTSPAGPVSGIFELLQWADSPVVTSGGTLVFNDDSIDGSFQARVSSVPLPGALVLFGSGL